ncbi:uncharacterized protein LOC144654719 isoform X2 [Oculina patagonica]
MFAQRQKASSGGIIAYNGDSARGWNDPPTFAFSNNKTGNKPKLDLRKRVSHQQALHGGQTPASTIHAPVVNNDDLTNGVAGLKLNGATQPLFTPPAPPVTTAAPPVSNLLGAPSMPALFTRSISTPSFTDAAVSNTSQASVNSVQAMNSPTVHAKSTDDLPGNLGGPLFDLKNHSFEPVRTAPLHSIRSTAEISDHLDDHHYSHSSPQIFHPITPPLTTAATVPNYQEGPLVTQPSIPPLGHVTPPPPLPFQPPVGHITPPLYPVHGQSPIPPTISPQGNGVVNHLPAGHSMTPPPPPGNHVAPPVSLSAGNTPRSTSPSGQDKNEDPVSSMDDQEGLKVTMDALQDVVEKLKDTLQKRVADDIARRLQVMSQNWTNGKLSQGVKSRMIKLAKALDDGNVDEAHHIHISLMVDFVAEVNQWMVAVKKLINLVRSSSAFPTHS